MRAFALFILFALTGLLQAQEQPYKVDFTGRDMGRIEVWNNDTITFNITNTGRAPLFLLPTQPQEDIQVVVSAMSIQPGETMTLGLVYYTERTGRFSKSVPVYLSASRKPLVLTIQGDIRNIDSRALTRCPVIGPSREEATHLLPVFIVVKDRATGERLDSAHVSLKQKPKYYKCGYGYGNNDYSAMVPEGLYTVEVQREAYDFFSGSQAFAEGRNTMTVYLDRKKNTEKNIVAKEAEDSILPYIPVTAKKDTIPAQAPKEEFDKWAYAPNHIVFLIDVSGSMQDSTKLPYLKIAMKQLATMLRPNDYVTMITYAGKTKTILENISGSQKELLYNRIDSLFAKGESRGAEGLKMAYASAKNHFISDGNNQVILATDGMFNDPGITEKQLYKLAKSNAAESVKLSVVAFGSKKTALDFLQTLSSNGKGEFLRINSVSEANRTLIEEIKKQSLRKE